MIIFFICYFAKISHDEPARIYAAAGVEFLLFDTVALGLILRGIAG